MLADTFLLLRLYWTIDRRADSGTKCSTRVIMIVGALFIVVISIALGAFAGSLTRDNSIIQIKAEILPGLLFTIVLFGIVFVGFGQALQALFLSDDLEKLLVAPVRPQAVMAAKLLSRMPSTVSIMLLATIPALIAFGIVVGLGPVYYILGVLLLLVTPLFGLSLGALVAIFLVRLLPARRLNEWVGAASIVIGALLSFLVFLPNMLGGRDQASETQTMATIENFVNQLGEIPLPSIWIGRALVELGRGQVVASAISALGIYILITVGLFLVTILLANRLFLTGWLRMQSSGTVARDIEARPGVFGRNSLDFVLGYKDWLLRIRDPRQLATMFSSTFVAGLILFLILRPGDDGGRILSIADDPGTADVGLDILSRGVVVSGLIYFAGWLIFQRMALASLSVERRAIYILRTAPLSASQLMRSKTMGIFLPYAILTTIALLAALFILKISLVWTPYAWMVLLIMGYGSYSYLVSLGFIYPNFEWDDPRRMVNRKASLPAIVGAATYSVLTIIIAATTFLFALNLTTLAIPIVILGLALMAGETWFFVNWCSNRVEVAWPTIGEL